MRAGVPGGGNRACAAAPRLAHRTVFGEKSWKFPMKWGKLFLQATPQDTGEGGIKNESSKEVNYIKNVTMNHSDVKYPTLEDLSGAAQALTRLQETYRLNVRELSEGILNGDVY
ncbi:Prolyl 4-hydroxylase alpha subunit, partial [Operophtera brumata]